MSLTGYLVIAALGAWAIVALTVGFSWLFARHYCRPRRCLPMKTPADYDLPYTPVTFTSQGIPLRGWFISANDSLVPQPTIILAHGWSTNATQMLPVARLLHDAGFGVLLYDVRGHGASGDDGPMTLLKFAEDLIAAADYLDGRPEVDMTRLGVVGHSMGGASAIVAASMESRIRVLVSSSAFADPVALTQDVMRARHIPRWPFLWLVCRTIECWLGTTIADIAPQNRIGQVTVPALLIHGKSDQFIPPSNMEALYAQAHQGRTQSWLVPGRRHSDVILDPDYGPWVIEFLLEHLSLG
jgi:pimeloyl-ACP methyl ester carboxylesterase